MKIYTIYPQGFASNTYAVTDDGINCILIDCAQPRVLSECKRLGLTPKAVLLTHGHYDHIGGCGQLYESGCKIYCGEDEKGFIFSQENAEVFGLPMPEFNIERGLSDGEIIKICGLEIKVLKTAGHTAGGVSYIIGENLFTGDTLFFGSVGRCDLPTGDQTRLISSVKKLYALEGNYKVYSGHGEATTLEYERKNNAFVRG